MSEAGFDPRKHTRTLRSAKGGPSEYLDVRWRIRWLREDAPASSIETELIEHEPGTYALFKATVVRIVEGEDRTLREHGRATGYGSETAKDFPDYPEKAETKAIGRALNALGYGLPEESASPAGQPAPAQTANAAQRLKQGTVDPATGTISEAASGDPGAVATRPQLQEIGVLARALRWGTQRINQAASEITGVADHRRLSGEEADYLIAHMTRMARVQELLSQLGTPEAEIRAELERIAAQVRSGELSPDGLDAVLAGLERRVASAQGKRS